MSFLGWGKYPMNSNVNCSVVNQTSSNNPANFGSNEIPGLTSPPSAPAAYYGIKSNVYAASGNAANAYPSLMKGGGSRHCVGGKKCGCGGFMNTRKIKRKIKNIVKVYKMKGKRSIKNIKNSLKKLFSQQKSRSLALAGGKRRGKTVKNRTRSRRHRKQKGGYAQYQNNLPLTPVYSVGARHLPASELALANPPPIKPLSTCVNCVDNYDHYTNKGFPSKGH